MRRIVSIFLNSLLPVALIIFLAGSGTASVLQTSAAPAVILTPEELAWVGQHPSFTVGGYPIPPFIIHNDKTDSGYVVDLIRAISTIAGLEPIFQIDSVKGMNAGLQGGTLDAGMGLVYSAQRDAWLEYSKPSLPIVFGIYARSEREDISDFASLQGKTVAVIKGDILNILLQKYVPGAKFVPGEDYAEIFQMVSQGKVDAVVQVRKSSDYHLRQNLISNVRAMANVQFGDLPAMRAHYYAVREDLPLLKSILDKAWYALPTAQKERIWNRWFDSSRPGDNFLYLTDNEQAWVGKHPVVRVPVIDFPPYIYWDNGPQGIAVESLKMVGNNAGFKIVFPKKMTRAKALDALRSHEDFDILPVVERTPELMRSFQFSKSQRSIPLVIFTREKEKGIYGLEALAGKSVAVDKSFGTAALLRRRVPQIQLEEFDSVPEALKAVSSGKVTAYVGMLTTAQHHIGLLGLNNLKVAAATGIDELKLAVAVRRDWPELASILSKGIASITPAERNSIYRKYFVVEVKQTVDYRSVAKWVVAIFLLFACILLWNFMLRRKVAKRTASLEKAHEQLRHAEKLSGIGRFSASIAHEINNPLAGVYNVLDRLQRKLTLGQEDALMLSMAVEECERMKRLINDLKSFNQPSSGEKSVFDLKETVQSILLLVKKELTSRQIRLETHFSPEPALVKAVEDQVKQVVLNLIQNGLEAMAESGGMLTVTIDSGEKTVAVRIHDNGSGISNEHLQHIFEPFFTTKSKVKGTGLGLSVSYSIIKSHGGELRVQSVPNRGTTFALTLPAYS